MDDSEDIVTMSQQMHAPASEPLSHSSNVDFEGNRGKVLNDPVHKTIRLGPLAVKLMDSPQFQRLRDLKQLGLTYYIFPGASHNRFEHSIGVAYLAYTFAYHYMRGQDDLNLTYHDLDLVQIAGLCHDLGHGPFSHVFESGFLKQEGITNWTHEEMSVKIFECIVADKGMVGTDLTQEDVDRVKDMILASHPGAAPERTGRQFLHEIVANGRNGLDVDKIDYLLRDARNCGLKSTIEKERLLTYSKVVENEICFKRLAYEDVLEVYRARGNMHKRCYSHRKGKAIDLMVVDILRAANPVLRITDMIWDPRRFVQLDDTIIKRIEFYDLDTLGARDRACMERAQAILTRLRTRDLYSYCGDWVIPSSMVERGWVEPTPEDVFAFLPPLSNVAQEDILLLTLSVDHTAGTKNPLEAVRFFDRWEDETAHHLDPRHMSGFHYECYKECSVRVYCRRSDKESVKALKEAADCYLKQHYGGGIQCSTPVRKSLQADLRESRNRDPTRKRQLFSVDEEVDPPAKVLRT